MKLIAIARPSAPAARLRCRRDAHSTIRPSASRNRARVTNGPGPLVPIASAPGGGATYAPPPAPDCSGASATPSG